MEKQLLTLKTVYNTIFAKDYPKYSEDVLKRDAKKGITLISFWRKILAVEFKSRKYGRLIWRESEAQNRHPSQVCNRKCEESLERNYFEEVLEELSADSFRHQIKLFESFLADKKARPDVLYDRLGMLADIVYNDDSSFTTESYSFFKIYLCDSDKFTRYDKKKQLILLSYLLSLLTIHAIAGNNMGDARLDGLVKQAARDFDAIFNASTPGGEEFSEVSYFTTNNTELNIMPLSKYHFFGRERELFDLCEIAVQGRKVALVGIGGMGKTELMRQVIARVEAEKLVKNIALIQYERNLRTSILAAFTRFSEGKEEEKLDNIFTLLEDCKKGELLVIIDNMNEVPKNSLELSRLLSIDASVIVTTRLPEISGFEKYELGAPSDEAKLLIFRDRYKKPLAKEDYDRLSNLWENDIFDHTLTRGLLGSVARHHNWTVDDILYNIRPEEGKKTLELKDLYVKTYSLAQFTNEEKRFLELFAEFPYVSIKGEYIVRWFQGVIPGIYVSTLNSLASSGWLMCSNDRYSMHPFVAECIGKRKNPDRVRFIENARNLFDPRFSYDKMFVSAGFVSYEPSREETVLGEVIVKLFENVTGDITREAFESLYQAVASYVNVHDSKAWNLVDKAEKMCTDLTPRDELIVYISKYTKYSKRYNLREELEKIKRHPAADSKMITEAAVLLSSIALVEGDGRGMIDIYRNIEVDETAPSVLVLYAFLLVGAYSAGDLEVLEEVMERGTGLEKSGRIDTVNDFENHKIYYYFAHAQFEKALECIERGRDYSGTVELSPENKVVMLENKATCFRMLGRFEEAEKIMQYCFEEKISLYGRSSIFIEATQGEYATALLKVGKYEAASEMYIDLIERVRTRGGADTQLFVFMNNLGNCYNAWDKPKDAETVLKQALKLCTSDNTLAFGEGNYNLSVAYNKLNEKEKCRQCARISLSVLEEAYGPDNPKVVLLKGYLKL